MNGNDEIEDPKGTIAGYWRYQMTHNTGTGETRLYMPSQSWWKFGAKELVGTFNSLKEANEALERKL